MSDKIPTAEELYYKYKGGNSKKEAVVQAINQFLKYYNNEKIHSN